MPELIPVYILAPGGVRWADAEALRITANGPALDPNAILMCRSTPYHRLRVERHGDLYAFDKSRCRDRHFPRSDRADLIPAADLNPLRGDEMEREDTPAYRPSDVR